MDVSTFADRRHSAGKAKDLAAHIPPARQSVSQARMGYTLANKQQGDSAEPDLVGSSGLVKFPGEDETG
jgi:hypothetical protein